MATEEIIKLVSPVQGELFQIRNNAEKETHIGNPVASCIAGGLNPFKTGNGHDVSRNCRGPGPSGSFENPTQSIKSKRAIKRINRKMLKRNKNRGPIFSCIDGGLNPFKAGNGHDASRNGPDPGLSGSVRDSAETIKNGGAMKEEEKRYPNIHIRYVKTIIFN